MSAVEELNSREDRELEALEGQGRADEGVSQKDLMLGRLLLDLDHRYKGHFNSLVERHGYVKTLDVLHRAKKKLAKSKMDLDALFSKAKTSGYDAFAMSQSFLTVSSVKGMTEATSLMKKGSKGLMATGEWILLKHSLERRWKVKNLNPSTAFISAYKRSDVSFEKRIRRLERILPRWCLAKLAENKDVIWYLSDTRHIRRIVKALEEGLKLVMSEDIVQATALVLLAREPAILRVPPEEIEKT